MLRHTKKVLALMLAAALLLGFTGAFAASSDIAINSRNFPDATFRKCLKAQFDKNKDGKLSAKEIAAATELDIDGHYPVKNLKGIEKLTALQVLMIDSGSDKMGALKSLNVSKNKKLKFLSVSRQKLTRLDLSKNTNLESLSVYETWITRLDLKKNPKLIGIYAWGNDRLTSVDLSRNAKLTEISVSWNDNLKTLKLGTHRTLKLFECSGSQLTRLDLSKYPNLTSIFLFYSGKLKTLKLGRLTKLTELQCEGTKLASLNIGGCTKLLNRVKANAATVENDAYIWTDKEGVKRLSIDLGTKLYNGAKAIKIKAK